MGLIALCLWVVVAAVLQWATTAKQSWPAAYGLMVAALPILWLLWQQSPLHALLGLAAMCSVLRWPVRYGWRRIRGLLR